MPLEEKYNVSKEQKEVENSMTRKMAALFLTLLLILSLIACGTKKPNNPNTGEVGSAVQELFVTTVDGKQVVVDAAGNAVDDYILDTDGNIVKADGKDIVVKAEDVKPYKDSADKDSGGDGSSSGSGTKDPASETENNNDSGSSGANGIGGSNGISGSSSGGAPGNENSGGGSKPSGGNSSTSGGSSGAGASDPPAPVHTHSWQKVYRTEIVDDYETREVSYCVCCGQDMTDWTNEQVNDHAENHVLNGESGQWRTEGQPFKIGSHEEKILDHYACSCGATKPV